MSGACASAGEARGDDHQRCLGDDLDLDRTDVATGALGPGDVALVVGDPEAEPVWHAATGIASSSGLPGWGTCVGAKPPLAPRALRPGTPAFSRSPVPVNAQVASSEKL
jgi:hypothetical protein